MAGVWMRNKSSTTKFITFGFISHLKPHPIQLLLHRNGIRSVSGSAGAPLVYPDPPSREHNDLSSYLKYAERTGLDKSSNTYVGTHYEYTVGSTLTEYGFFLRRVGGASDYGIDLLGTWRVPSSIAPLRVIIQCKAVRNPNPNLMRELEGAFVGAPPGWRAGPGVLGLLVTEKPATKGIRESLTRSRWPMGFITCTRDGQLQQMLWNHRAQEEGLEGLGTTLRHSSDSIQGTSLALTYNGKPFLAGQQYDTSAPVDLHPGG